MMRFAGRAARRPGAAIIAGALIAAVPPVAAYARGSADSALARTWSAVDVGRVDIERSSASFPWNDEEHRAALGNRLALLGEVAFGDLVSLFGKGACGYRLGGEYQNNRCVLEQGHVGFELLDAAVRARFFARERVYRTDQRLLKLLSDDSPMFAERGEGLALEMEAGSHFSVSFIESILKDELNENDGLPSFSGGGDVFRTLRLEGFQRARWHAGFTMSQARSTQDGDRVAIGADLGFRARGIDFLAELARLQEGTWEDLRERSLFGLNPRGEGGDRSHSLFSERNAFAAEIEGLKLDMKALGAAGIVPGYLFGGSEFEDPSGEIVAGVEQGYVLAWWKPARSDALISLDAVGGSDARGDFKRLSAHARLRYRGGFEVRESVMCRTGDRTSAAVSLIDDNALSRLAVSARVDDLGARNELSYLAESAINLSSRFTAKGALYLCRSQTGRYHMELEFRPRERYLLQVSCGSFMPQYEGIAFDNALRFDAPAKDRFMRLYARVWFGGGGAR